MEDLRGLRAKMNLAGLSRREAAKALYLSYSTLNRKLRGELSLTEGERACLLLLIKRKEPVR